MDRYICIHGHFYQPPRENPWLEAIELQDSAYPYHDWNERITAECYAPNAVSRILDGDHKIIRIVNNYGKISFNFGPTLLSWLAEQAPDVYHNVLAADRASQQLFSGHGSAIAQAYNHMIMPLANARDKRTQIMWGLRDFETRFGRKPEGMWLPETAVDLESLDLLAEQGIRFTVLSPYQASHIRLEEEEEWTEVSGGRVDPSMAYTVSLPSGCSIAVFFYDGPISRAVAFEGLLKKGEYLAERLTSAFSDTRDWPQLAHIATDGETYGHHHPHGDMALAYALEHIESGNLARLTNYSEFLERFPPQVEARIVENSSWSCVHGIERWRSNCGCNSGGHGDWNQEWRAPLRVALDWLRDELAPLYERQAASIFNDPWGARDRYIDLILNRSAENVQQFFNREQSHLLDEKCRIQALKLLEVQRHAMLMYTSCGWFFDELSGIETVEVIQYAGRAVQLSQELFGDHLEERFLERLEQAKSNLPEHQDGRVIYEKFVKPAVVNLEKVGAHYAVSSLFENYEPHTKTYCYDVAREDYRMFSAGRARLVLGRARITSEIVRESENVSFGVVHLGDHNLSGGVREFRGEEGYQQLYREIPEIFERGDFAETIRVVDRNFGSETYTLKLLFRDEQRRILQIILESTLTEADAAYRRLFESHAPLMRFLADLNQPLPSRLQVAAEFTLNADLRHALDEGCLDLDRIKAWIEEARRSGVTLDTTTLEYALRGRIEATVKRFKADPADSSRLRDFEAAVGLASSLPFTVNLWAAQNVYFDVQQSVYPQQLTRAEEGDENARAWIEHFRPLAGKLSVRGV